MTVNLLVDIGSSAIKWCLWTSNTAACTGSLLHRERQYVSELHKAWLGLPKPASIWVASVAPGPCVKQVAQICLELWGLITNLVQTEKAAFGVVNGYSSFSQLGVDRWLAMLGARQRCKDACCVVDCGTAATVDIVNSNGEHLGGYILPGVGTGRRALLASTQIPRITDVDPSLQLGCDTASAVALGTRLAIVGVIDHALAVLGRFEPAGELFLTGSEAELLRPWLPGSTHWTPDLVFEGLGRYASRGN